MKEITPFLQKFVFISDACIKGFIRPQFFQYLSEKLTFSQKLRYLDGAEVLYYQ